MDIVSPVKEFLTPRFNQGLVIVLLLIGLFLVFSPQTQEIHDETGTVVDFFYLPTCPHCAEQKPILLELQEEMPDVTFAFHDASSDAGSRLFYELASTSGLDASKLAVPTTFINEHHPLVGVHSKQEIIDTMEYCRENCVDGSITSKSQEISTGFTEFELPFLGRTNLTEFSLPVLAIVLGLIDGFNPCAMWVLVYLIALLVNIKDKKKTWIIVGTFVLSSGILYFLFMTAWLNVFLLLGYVRILTILVGLIALGGGILSVKEYLTTKGALACKVGDEEAHKKTAKRVQDIITLPLSLGVLISIIILAFVVNSIEFVCSSAIPAVFTQILALSDLSGLEYYFYIALYDFFFMLDDLIIFGLAAFAVNSTFGERYAKYCKFLGGAILVLLGLILLFAPNLLS